MSLPRLVPIIPVLLAFPAAAQDAAPPPATTPPAPVVTLLEAGAAPHRRLRLAPRVGAGHAVDLTTHVEAEQKVDGGVIPTQKMPRVTFSFQTTVTAVNAAGEITYDLECTGAEVGADPEIPPHVTDTMRNGIQPLVGLRGTGVITERAVSRGTEMAVTPDLPPDLGFHVQAIEDLMDQIATPLPEEPIGVGGSWRVTSTLVKDGITIAQTVTCTLARVDDAAIELALDIAQEAAAQPVSAPNLPPNASMILESYRSEGTGRGTLRLDRLFPDDLHLDVVNDSALVLDWAGQYRQQVSQHMKMTTEMKAKRGQTP